MEEESWLDRGALRQAQGTGSGPDGGPFDGLRERGPTQLGRAPFDRVRERGAEPSSGAVLSGE
ncbi:hypothetical protein ASF06_10260 [Agreia sp. Leaf244]|nr:hypothetical protein ASF06_10260 [Agreia sp. Leaf244]